MPARPRRVSFPSAPRNQATRPLRYEPLEMRLPLAVTLLDENFDAYPVNTLPGSADFALNATGPEGFIQIGGPGGKYGTPIAPSGNKSLIFDNPGAAQPVVSWTSEFANDPAAFRSGRVSFDLFLPEPTGLVSWTYLDVRLGYGGAGRTSPTTVNDTTIWNSFRVNRFSADVVRDDGNGGATAAISSMTTLKVEYVIDGVNRTYRLLINGSAVTFGGSADRPWMAGAPGINMLAFVGAFPQNSGPVAIDNLRIVSDTDPRPPWTPPADEPTSRLEWHQHRGNARLSGLAEVDDNVLQNAGILWSEFVGARESWVAAAPAGPGRLVALPSANQSLSPSERVSWGVGGPYFDLDGTGALTAEATSSSRIVGDFIPGNGKLELLEAVVFDTTFGQGAVRLFARSGGGWVQQWQSPTIPSMFGIPNLLAGDFDADGALEVALTPWNDVVVLSMATGQIEKTGTFKPAANESGRGYGWFGAYELTGDQRSEFVVMGDFQDFITVMGWNAGGNLVKLWERVFDPRLASKQTKHRPGAFPVRDVTGDGKPEIATSIFNDTGDQRWRIKVFNAQNGTLVSELADHAVDGARDVNGDGDYELFVRQTAGSLLPGVSTLKILDWNGSGWNTLWSQADAAFVAQDVAAFPVHVNSAASTGKLDLLAGRLAPGGPETFFVRSPLDAEGAQLRVEAWQWQADGAFSRLGVAEGPKLDALAVRAAPPGETSVLFSAEVFGDPPPPDADFNLDNAVNPLDVAAWEAGWGKLQGALRADGDANRDQRVDGLDLLRLQRRFGETSGHKIALTQFDGQPVQSAGSAPPRSTAVVGRLAGPVSPPAVVVQGAAQNVAAFRPRPDGSVDPLWTLPGIGGSTGASQFTGQHETSGVALAKLVGDGSLATLLATVGPAGQARLVAVQSDGQELWHADFDVPGGPRVFNEPGLTLWRTGYFTTAEHHDVLVQTMRGTGGTGEFHLLNGRTGAVRWRRTFGNTPGSNSVARAAGEAHMPVYDWDGDGLDEAVNFHPDMFYVVDGTGVNLVDKAVLGGGVFPGGSPLYGTPVVDDFLGNGTDTVLWAGSYSQLGLVSKYGVNIWHTPFVFDNTPGFIQGVGDVDGNGTLELLSPGHPQSAGVSTPSFFQAINAATGAVRWTVPLPGRGFAPVGGAYSDTPTLSVSADLDQDGRDESLFAIGTTLYVVGANPDGASGRIEWTFAPDGGLLGAPVIADANGDGLAEIVVVSTTGYVYGIGSRPAAATAPLADASAAAGRSAASASVWQHDPVVGIAAASAATTAAAPLRPVADDPSPGPDRRGAERPARRGAWETAPSTARGSRPAPRPSRDDDAVDFAAVDAALETQAIRLDAAEFGD